MGSQTGIDEYILNALSNTAVWFEQVVPEDGILVTFDGNRDTYTMGDMVLFDRVREGKSESWQLRLPPDLNGNTVTIDYINSPTLYKCDAKVTNESGELVLYVDILADGLPETLPTTFDLSGHIRIGGTALEESGLGLDVAFSGKSDGYNFSISQIRAEDGTPMLTAYGAMTVKEAQCPVFGPASATGFNILSVNDRSLFTFINRIMKPFIKTALPVLEELPVSTYQSLYGFLEQYGILDLLMSGM
ncbi:MAG: hypothetical protein Q4C54_02885 [Clostridia bacterium]|nr:hypothetical protein [Clostridia bacterium]